MINKNRKPKAGNLDLNLALWGFVGMVVGALLSTVCTALHFTGFMLQAPAFTNVLVPCLALVFLVGGGVLFFTDVLIYVPKRKLGHDVENRYTRLGPGSISVALTCWNDQEAVAASVRDFLSNPLVCRVIVMDNNSSDNSYEVAKAAGAEVFIESRPGYGHCVKSALEKAVSYEDTEFVALCEGDMTFRGDDLAKLVAYLPHADLVNGTRIVEQLRSQKTQLTHFMYWGNFFAAKLLELKHLGRGTLTDLGTTYKLARSEYLKNLLPDLDRNVNLEFNAHLLDVVLSRGDKLVEAPVTFYPRVGKSKGGNVSNLRAVRVGLRMISGFTFGWNMYSKPGVKNV